MVFHDCLYAHHEKGTYVLITCHTAHMGSPPQGNNSFHSYVVLPFFGLADRISLRIICDVKHVLIDTNVTF